MKPQRTFEPTEEQQKAREVFAVGHDLALIAGAGTGKTSTLALMAASTRSRACTWRSTGRPPLAGRRGRGVGGARRPCGDGVHPVLRVVRVVPGRPGVPVRPGDEAVRYRDHHRRAGGAPDRGRAGGAVLAAGRVRGTAAAAGVLGGQGGSGHPVARGRAGLDELITGTYSLDQVNQGYADIAAGRVLRGVIAF